MGGVNEIFDNAAFNIILFITRADVISGSRFMAISDEFLAPDPPVA